MVHEMNAYYRLSAILLSCAFCLPGAQVNAAQTSTSAGTGLDQRVKSGAHVVLTGNGWTTADRVVRFVWTQVAGPGVRLRDANRSTAKFIAPKVTSTAVLKFRLTVTDIRGGKGSGIVTVTVQPRIQTGASDTPRGDTEIRAAQLKGRGSSSDCS